MAKIVAVSIGLFTDRILGTSGMCIACENTGAMPRDTQALSHGQCGILDVWGL